MTKTNNKHTNSDRAEHRLPLYRRAWFLGLIVILIIAAVVTLIIILVKPKSAPTSTDAEQNNTTQEVSQPTPDKVNDGQHINDDQPYSDPDQITPQYEGENPNRASELSGSVTYTDYNDGVLSIGTMIDQYLSEGTCELKLTGSNGNNYAAKSDIIAAASTSACYDLSVNVVPDAYQIEIILMDGDKEGIITSEVKL